MRTCDICSTPIPLGTDRCPNCGYRYRPEKSLNRVSKKESYMSQFQPHPSPLDELKKGEIPDFSKVYSTIKDTFNKQATRTVRPTRRKGNPFLIIPILILFMIASTFIFGVSYSFSQIFDSFDFMTEDIFEYHQHFDYYEDLPETCSYEIKPYYDRMVQLVDDYDIYDYGMMQSYDVYDGDDVSVWMQCSIEYEDVMVNIDYSTYEFDEPWTENYSVYYYYDEGQPVEMHTQAIIALSEITGLPYEDLEACAKDFFNQVTGLDRITMYYQVQGAEFYLNYDHRNMDYGITMETDYE